MLLTPWIESVVVAFIGFSAFLVGRLCSRLPKPYWLAGYLFPLGVIILYGLGLEGDRVLVADPLTGLTSTPTEEFTRQWLFYGGVLRRSSFGSR